MNVYAHGTKILYFFIFRLFVEYQDGVYKNPSIDYKKNRPIAQAIHYKL